MRVARAMMMTMRVAGEGEGKGGKAIAMATRVADEQMATLTKSVMAARKR